MAGATKAPEVNRLNLPRTDYEGAKSTLCIGCGHDLITRYITDSMWLNGTEPHRVAKVSGIGCSSKTPAYFLGKSWGFNSVHGRSPAIVTGAACGNKDLLILNVSGDGDTASIGMGQFVHLIRRNPRAVYIVENNGVYGLTKGQFSATADKGSRIKSGAINSYHSIDLCSLALELGCGFVARAFAGNKNQMQAVLRAAAAFPGLAFVDVISPCVTFNNFDYSKYGFNHMKEHSTELNVFGFVQSMEHIEEEIGPGETRDVQFPDGSMVRFTTLADDHDPTDRDSATAKLHQYYEKETILTGVFYINSEKATMGDVANMTDTPLAMLPDEDLRPSADVLNTIMSRHL